MHRDVGMAMIKALIGLAPKTYQTGAWPGIGEFVRVRPVIGATDTRPESPMAL
jgi:hypothetical protein